MPDLGFVSLYDSAHNAVKWRPIPFGRRIPLLLGLCHSAAEAARKRFHQSTRADDEDVDMPYSHPTYINSYGRETVLERVPSKALVNRLGRATHYQHF